MGRHITDPSFLNRIFVSDVIELQTGLSGYILKLNYRLSFEEMATKSQNMISKYS